MEKDVVRTAAFDGNSFVVDLFLSSDDSFVSDLGDHIQAAIHGAGEACRCCELALLISKYGSIYDPIKAGRLQAYASEYTDHDMHWKRSETYMVQSLAYVVLNSYINESFSSSINDKKEMKTL